VSAGEKFDFIALGMPMPVDVFATLGDLINKAWPGADIIVDAAAAGVPPEVMNQLGIGWGGIRGAQIIRIPTSRKGRRIAKRDAQAIVEENTRELDAEDGRLNFEGFSESGVGFSGMPEELQLRLGDKGMAILAAHEGAINYVEWEVRATDGTGAVLCIARSKGQTAHALRTKAEDKIARALARIEKVDALYDSPEAESLGRELRDLLA
jgi:hypothetical protein